MSARAGRGRTGVPLKAALLAVAALSMSTTAGAQSVESVPAEILRGRQITFLHLGTERSGELLAVSPDTLWLHADGATTAYPMGAVADPWVLRHGFTFGKAMTWSLVVGVASGIGLTAACSSVDGASCDGILPIWVLGSAGVGALVGAAMRSSGRRELLPDADLLRPYSRFPQGMPERFEESPAAGPGG